MWAALEQESKCRTNSCWSWVPVSGVVCSGLNINGDNSRSCSRLAHSELKTDHFVVPSFQQEECRGHLGCRCPLHFQTCQTISLPSFASLPLPILMCENMCYLEKKSQSPITIYKNFYYYGLLSQDFVTYISLSFKNQAGLYILVFLRLRSF